MYENNLVSKTNTLKTFCFDSLCLTFLGKYLIDIEIDFSGNSVKLPSQISENNVDILYLKTLENFVDLLESLKIDYEKIFVETYSYQNNTETLLKPNEGIVNIKIGESIFAKFLGKKLMAIRKSKIL